MTNGITLQIFSDPGSALSKEMIDFAQSLRSSRPSLTIDIQDSQGGTNEYLKSLRIEYWPCIVLKKDDFTRIRYYGVPTGFETSPFTDAIDELSASDTKLSENSKTALSNVRRRANIKVFILTTCTFCPVMARYAYRAAIESPRISAEVIDSSIFTEWAQKHLVMGVPKVILNDNTDITGAVREEEFIEKLRDADYALIDSMYG